MAESNDSNPFTNTRLMVAGIVVGLVGIVLAFWAINKKVNEATGGTENICVLTRNIEMTEPIKKSDIKSVPVSKRFFDATAGLVKYEDHFFAYDGLKPIRNMFAGEPLKSYDFPTSDSGAGALKPRPGYERKSIDVDVSESLGKGVGIGTTVNVWAVLDMGKEPGERRDVLLVLDRVRVVLINGESKTAQRVNTVTVEISPQAVRFLMYLAPYVKGKLQVTAVEDQSNPLGKEIPEDTLRVVRSAIGLPSGIGQGL